jgi:hypothetical protein
MHSRANICVRDFLRGQIGYKSMARGNLRLYKRMFILVLSTPLGPHFCFGEQVVCGLVSACRPGGSGLHLAERDGYMAGSRRTWDLLACRWSIHHPVPIAITTINHSTSRIVNRNMVGGAY